LFEAEELNMYSKKTALLIGIFLLITLIPCFAHAQVKDGGIARGKAVLWQDPGDISSRDLKYGPGSAERQPLPPFSFVEEDTGGASPKFRVKDANGVTWVVKLGVESQAETAATRLIWAVGFFAEEMYHLPQADIEGLPRLARGGEHVRGKTVLGARFEARREGTKIGPTWDWQKNPFTGTRELDGLKVLMVLLANYDTSPANNHIVTVANPETGALEDRYVVTDLGATLGHVGGLGGKRTKNDLEDFRSSRFVVEVEEGMVEFAYRTRPQKLSLFASVFNPWYHKSQSRKEKAMRRIPVDNVRWIGTLLSALTDDQLRAAFRAAHYDASTMEGFVSALRGRIGQLRRLPGQKS
jgi:hypothetical protein